MQHERNSRNSTVSSSNVSYLRSVPAARQIDYQISALGIPAIGRQSHFTKRQTVFKHGDPATHLFWVEQGAVMIQQYLKDGRRQLVEIILPGDIRGFSRGQTYGANCETLEPSVLRVCCKKELERCTEFSWLIVRQVERQLCAMQEHALGLGRMTAQERVCALLLKLVGTKFEDPKYLYFHISGALNLHIQLPMTRGEIGDYLGHSLETVCRTMTELQRNSVIEIGQNHRDVVICGFQRLKKLAGYC